MNGADKARLLVRGRSIASAQIEMLQTRCDAIAMVVAEPSQAAGLPVHALYDRVGGLGPLDGIAAALVWSPSPWVLVVACDMPDVSPAVVDLLLSKREPAFQIVAMMAEGRVQPLLALYQRTLLPVLDGKLEANKLRASELLESPPVGVSVRLLDESEVRRVDPKTESFRNVNRPEDLSHS